MREQFDYTRLVEDDGGFDVENLKNGPFAEIVALSNAQYNCVLNGSMDNNDLDHLSLLLNEKIIALRDGLNQIVDGCSEKTLNDPITGR
jgi:hypothetical protein